MAEKMTSNDILTKLRSITSNTEKTTQYDKSALDEIYKLMDEFSSFVRSVEDGMTVSDDTIEFLNEINDFLDRSKGDYPNLTQKLLILEQIVQSKTNDSFNNGFHKEVLRTFSRVVDIVEKGEFAEDKFLCADNSLQIVSGFISKFQKEYEKNSTPQDEKGVFESLLNRIREEFKKRAQIAMQTGEDDKLLSTCKPLTMDVVGIIDYIKLCPVIGGNSINKNVYIDLETFKELSENNNLVIPRSLKVIVVCKNISEVSLEDLIKLQDKDNCFFQFNDINLGQKQLEPYSINEFIMCKKIINELVEGVEILPQNVKDREKIMFGQVVRKIAQYVSPDYETAKKEDELREKIKAMLALPIEEQDFAEMTRLSRECEELGKKAESLLGGLSCGRALCAGFAEILRNVLPHFGIECRYVSGREDDDKYKDGHAWNQVKLDGKWYNVDLTWARDAIVGEKDDDIDLLYLLADSKSFESGEYERNGEKYSLLGHSEFSIDRGIEEECTDVLTLDDIRKILGLKAKTHELSGETKDQDASLRKSFLTRIARNLNFSNVINSAKKFISSIRKKDRDEVDLLDKNND